MHTRVQATISIISSQQMRKKTAMSILGSLSAAFGDGLSAPWAALLLAGLPLLIVLAVFGSGNATDAQKKKPFIPRVPALSLADMTKFIATSMFGKPEDLITAMPQDRMYHVTFITPRQGLLQTILSLLPSWIAKSESPVSTFSDMFASFIFVPSVSIKEVHRKEYESFQAIAPLPSLGKLIGRGALVTADTNEEHRKLRALQRPVFDRNTLRAFVPIIEDWSKRCLDSWVEDSTVPVADSSSSSSTSSSSSEPGRRMLTTYEMGKQFAMRFAVYLLFGDYLSQDLTLRLIHLFVDWLSGFNTFVTVDLPFTDFGKAMNARRELVAILQILIRNKKETMMKNGAESGNNHDGNHSEATATAQQEEENKIEGFVCALDRFLKNTETEDGVMTEEGLINSCLLVMFAAHDTAASTISSILVVLKEKGMEHHLEKIAEEIKENEHLFEHGLTMESLDQLHYLNGVVMEVLRLHNPVGGFLRKVIKDVEISGYLFKAGDVIFCGSNTCNLSEQFFPDPMRFEPERHFPGREETKKSEGSFMTFGGGPHVCLGMDLAKLEFKVLLYTIAKGYTWTLLERHPTNRFPAVREVGIVRFHRREIE